MTLKHVQENNPVNYYLCSPPPPVKAHSLFTIEGIVETDPLLLENEGGTHLNTTKYTHRDTDNTSTTLCRAMCC